MNFLILLVASVFAQVSCSSMLTRRLSKLPKSIKTGTDVFIPNNIGATFKKAPGSEPLKSRRLVKGLCLGFALSVAATSNSEFDYQNGFVTHALASSNESFTDEYIKNLCKSVADVNRRNGKGETPLELAVKSGNRLHMYLLIKSGADVDALDSQGNSYLLTAAINKQKFAFDALIASGLSIEDGDLMKHTMQAIAELGFEADLEEMQEMKYPALLAKLYVMSSCDAELYKMLKSIGLNQKDLSFLRLIESNYCSASDNSVTSKIPYNIDITDC